jgi:shikimate dehydrogenase
LRERGVARLYIANRSFDRAVALQERFGSSLLPVRWEEMGELLASTNLLVNTTSLGMHGQPPLQVRVDRLPPAAVVADIVYVPLLTDLLADAKARGLRTADGLGMLLRQAVRGFSLWFGVTPEVTPELRAVVEADIVGGPAARPQPE